MARILMVSKFRKVQGGPERHLFDLMEGLTRRGHQVKLFSSEDVEDAGGIVFSASAEGNDRLQSAKSLLWNTRSRSLLSSLVAEFQPDLVHFHSVYHQLSPSVLGAFNGPTLMTLHDYKLSAPCYSLYREGEVCQACVGRIIATPAIRHKCVSNSRMGSALCAVEGIFHRHRYRSLINRFIVPSQFAYDVAIRGGLPASRVSIIPWGVAVERVPSPYEPRVAFFGGRLLENKGLLVLLDAWRSLPTDHGCRLRVAGSGELEEEVKSTVRDDATVEYLGMLPGPSVIDEVRKAAVAVMPSLVPETMGLAAIEALVAGTPVIASQRGALADLRGLGVWTLRSVDQHSIRRALIELLVEGAEQTYRQSLRNRDLTSYSFEGMVSAIESEYLRTVNEFSQSSDGQ